jgi:hypothetical protein
MCVNQLCFQFYIFEYYTKLLVSKNYRGRRVYLLIPEGSFAKCVWTRHNRPILSDWNWTKQALNRSATGALASRSKDGPRHNIALTAHQPIGGPNPMQRKVIHVLISTVTS